MLTAKSKTWPAATVASARMRAMASLPDRVIVTKVSAPAGSVTVTRFLALGTIEERINSVLEEKRELFHAVFGGEGTARRRGLSREDLFGLFKLELPDGVGHAAA